MFFLEILTRRVNEDEEKRWFFLAHASGQGSGSYFQLVLKRFPIVIIDGGRRANYNDVLIGRAGFQSVRLYHRNIVPVRSGTNC